MIYFYLHLFRAIPAAFILKVIVIQRFWQTIGPVFKDGTVLIPRYA